MGVEERACEHAADEEYAHCGAGHGRGAELAVGDNERHVGAENGIGGDKQEDDYAVQPCLFGDVQIASALLLAALDGGLVLGQVDAAEYERDEAEEIREVGVVPVNGGEEAADEGQVDAAAVCERVLDAHDGSALLLVIVLGDDAVRGRHEEAKAEAEDYLPREEQHDAAVEEEAEHGDCGIAGDAELAEHFLAEAGGQQRRDNAADEHCEAGEVGHGLDDCRGHIREGLLYGGQRGLESHAAHLQRGDE